MSKNSKRHIVYYSIEDEYGCTVYVLEWSGEKNRFSHQEIAQIAEKQHTRRRARSYANRQEEVHIRIGKDNVWTTIKDILWWIGAYTVVIIKFLFKLSWKMIVLFFVFFIGQVLLGLFLTR